jgi:hypothetical protein
LEDKTPPTKGDILQNPSFSPFGLTNSIIKDGILDFGNIYMKIQDYKSSGKAETTGTLAVIGFKVLKDAAAEVIFDDLNAMPGAINGTMVFDWDGAQIKSGYSIINPGKINETSQPIPLPSFTSRPSQQSQTSASPAPESSVSASPDNSKASDSSADTGNKTNESKSTTNKSNLLIIIIVLSAVVVLIPTIIVVLMLKRKK